MNNDLLKSHAKSFYWAGFFLSKDTYSKCSALYNFCRTLDDIADSSEKLEIKKQKFLKFKNNFLNKNFDNLIIKSVWKVVDDVNISQKVVLDLFDGVETDLKERVKIQSKKDLLVYSYRVAGTVGLMMSKILNVVNKESLKGAIDLGIAMQLTNIARDVVEDKDRNRKYIECNFSSIREVIINDEYFY
jgi:phytoene synthase